MVEVEEVAHLLESLMKRIVNRPDELTVNIHQKDDKHVIFQVQVSSTDAGQLIGIQVRTARAFRVILGALSAKLEKRIVLNIEKTVLQ